MATASAQFHHLTLATLIKSDHHLVLIPTLGVVYVQFLAKLCQNLIAGHLDFSDAGIWFGVHVLHLGTKPNTPNSQFLRHYAKMTMTFR